MIARFFFRKCMWICVLNYSHWFMISIYLPFMLVRWYQWYHTIHSLYLLALYDFYWFFLLGTYLFAQKGAKEEPEIGQCCGIYVHVHQLIAIITCGMHNISLIRNECECDGIGWVMVNAILLLHVAFSMMWTGWGVRINFVCTAI